MPHSPSDLEGRHAGYAIGSHYVARAMRCNCRLFRIAGCTECDASVWADTEIERTIRSQGFAPRVTCTNCIRRLFPDLKAFPIARREKRR